MSNLAAKRSVSGDGPVVVATDVCVHYGTTVALKILDGSLRAATVVALKLLVEAGTVDRSAANEVLVRLNPVVTGGGKPVGAVRASYV